MEIILTNDNRKHRKPWRWTAQNEQRAADIKAVLDSMRRYLPLTERGLYYRLLDYTHAEHWKHRKKGKLQSIDVYAALGRLLKWMRIEGRIEKNVIIDEHRSITAKAGYSTPLDFVMGTLGSLKHGGRWYRRCNAQKQGRYVEIWLEKAALLHFVEPVADEFCRRVVVCKGYNSISFQCAFFERAMDAMGYDQKPTVLYFGDWDPSGENMLLAAMQTLQDELGLFGVDYIRCGLNPDHFGMVTANPVPIKERDSRARAFIKKYGDTAYELDAFHPEQLKIIVRDAIEKYTDMTAYQWNMEQQELDRQELTEWGDIVSDYAERTASEMFNLA